MVSLKRASQIIATMIGQCISEATLLGYVMLLYHALEDWEQNTITQILAQPVIHSDETSLRVDRKNHWIHVYSGGNITLKFLSPHRGREAIEAIGIIPRYNGIIIHDCWAAYLSYDHCDHGLCGAHLLRELTFIVDSNGYRWAKNMKRLLKWTSAIVTKKPEKCLSPSEYDKLCRCYRNILAKGERELPPLPPRPKGKRGRLAKPDAHNLWERLQKHEQAVLLFAKLPYVPFTNKGLGKK
jgi:hypothetical protein